MKKTQVFKVIVRIVIAIILLFTCAISGGLLYKLPPIGTLVEEKLIAQDAAGTLLACIIMMLSYAMATVIAIVATRILTRQLDNNPISSLGMRIDRTAVSWLIAMLVIAVIIMAATTGLLELIGVSGKPAIEGSANNSWWVAVLITVGLAFLLQGIPEEVVFRGWLIPSLGNNRFAVITSVLVFTVPHLLSNGGQQNFIERIIYLAVPFGFAVAAAVVRVVSGSTWAAIGVHAGFHMASLLAFFLPVENSPTQWVVLGVAWLLVGVVIGWRWDFLGKLNADVAR